jgi:hypothetical protein
MEPAHAPVEHSSPFPVTVLDIVNNAQQTATPVQML